MSKLEYASVVWNSLSLTDSNKIENIQRQFSNICYYRFFQADILRNYNSILIFSISDDDISMLYFL
jgi:lipopolysaccharide biosynthesis glycosyltransferase